MVETSLIRLASSMGSVLGESIFGEMIHWVLGGRHHVDQEANVQTATMTEREGERS